MRALLLLLTVLVCGGCVSETVPLSEEAHTVRLSQAIPSGVTGIRTRDGSERERRLAAAVLVLTVLSARQLGH